jgi:hypothetical protein
VAGGVLYTLAPVFVPVVYQYSSTHLGKIKEALAAKFYGTD